MMLTCHYSQCGVTFKKCSSYKQHKSRYHCQPHVQNNGEENIVDNIPNNVVIVQNAQNIGDPIVAPLEEFNWTAAQFIVDIRENCKVSQVATNKIINGVTDLMKLYTTNILNEIKNQRDPNTNLVDANQLERLLQETYDPTLVFEPIKSKWTVLNGTYYRENEVFRQMENPLAVILYYDDVGIANPLGSHSTTQKLGMFYWTLANIDPKLRSSQNSIFLLAIVKAKLIKKFGLEKLLKPFIDDMKILRTRGVFITVDGEDLLFKGSLLFCAGILLLLLF
ncbi:uncharacterized protein LOC122504105 [Leptopilina heterotoma]|uniref:uncharacterized protein LOC122504105 n=1 Tax=Leptopilina heterotoma TaxID=63436 RepID=UPI001CA9418D|nr:uncharacterized protein LOC122504105 [Leptopilina heterotoma]